MSDILVSRPGHVSVVQLTHDAVPGSVRISKVKGGGFGGGVATVDVIQSSRVIITGATYSQSANIQFQQSLKDAIYMYVFGERMGQIEISGMAFASACTDTDKTTAGVDDILAYYQDGRASKSGDAISIIIGKTPITGFLVGCNVRMVNPVTMMYGFSFALATVPPGLDSNPNK